MILVDANLLLYAHAADGGIRNETARTWLEELLETEPDVRLGLATLLAFLRISTDPRIYAQPRTPAEVIGIVEALLARPNVTLASPGDRHWTILTEVAASGRVRGSMLMDAHLAALAMEHGATLATSDRGFTRFPGLRHVDPLAR
jgi:toxin-antitoxin system PIN domain toxin